MRVLHLTTHLNSGGITNYILRLIQPLKSLDCEVSILSAGGEMTPFFKEYGTKTFELPIRTKSEVHPKLYRTLPKIRRLIRENQIDVLHAHTRVTQVMAFFLQKLTGIPVVTTCHGFYKRRLGRRLLPAWGDAAIAISQPVADHLRNDFRVPQEKVPMINNGVDLEEMDALYSKIDPAYEKKIFGFQDRDIVIGIVARLVSDKGHEYLIRATAELEKKFPNIRLLVVGDGNYRSSLEKLVQKLRLEKTVTFTGNLSNVDVLRALSTMDIFALPATWREGFGLSIVEAMTCRKPVIVTNIWSLNSLIQNNETGIMIEPKQVAPLAEALEYLIANPSIRSRIANAGRTMTEKFFSISRMAAEILEVYKKVIAARSPKPPS